MSTESKFPIVAIGVGRGFPKVQGKCPSCGRTSLFVGVGGYVTCASLECADPVAATKLLEDWNNVRAVPQ